MFCHISLNYLKEPCTTDCTIMSWKGKSYLYQHGFQAGHSTAMSLLNIQDKISQAIDNNEYSNGLFLDLSKAFDSVDHNLLLKSLKLMALEGYRFVGLEITWIIDNNRSNVTIKYIHFALLNMEFSKVPSWGRCYSCYLQCLIIYAFWIVCWWLECFYFP